MSVAASVEDLCRWTGGGVLRGESQALFDRTVIDSREAGAGALFVAIVGERHDAHSFVETVLASGAAGVVIQSDHMDGTIGPSDGFVVHVPDTTRALADLSRGHRQSFAGPLIGITGSNGKTTTKELCAGILEQHGPTLATRGNLNNQFGVPLTLLRRETKHEFAIIEMGMNHRGEIADLAAIAEPTVGVLTNVGTAHIEFLGSRENIAEEKGDLLAALPASGTAVIGRDDPLAFDQSERTSARILSFGRDARADLCANRVRSVDRSAFAFDFNTPFGRGEVRVPGLAETIVDNALAAAGGALAAGASFDEVVTGLASHAGVPGRMQAKHLPGDILLIDDSYNANPQSMRNALESLANLETRGRRYAVLGEMGELGRESDRAHREAGELVGELELDGLFILGASAELIAEGARAAGQPADSIHIEGTHEAIGAALREQVSKGDCILIKGSRAAAMERVIPALSPEDAD
jgi:UDP-N-acetylmuramoyl-tripeptide--D-alanyl-D-alanine ligase